MIAFKLAIRNLFGAGLRTWLNVFILSLAYIVIIWQNGFIQGWNEQARNDMIEWEYGGGQYWHPSYDPLDPFSFADSHQKISENIQKEISKGEITPILFSQASIYPEGRVQSALLKGIDPNQKIIKLPSEFLLSNGSEDYIPVIIGSRMAKNTKLKTGDLFTIRWRDTDGTFDAAEVKVLQIFSNNVPSVDQGIVWLPIERLQDMLQVENEASILIQQTDIETNKEFSNWTYKDHVFLFADLDQIIKSKSIGGSVMYLILILLAMLAIFDTQVLSIFRRQKEIGTQIALGMTRWQVVKLFTIEGAMYAILATILAAAYGIPFLAYSAKIGFAMPEGADQFGIAMAERIIPSYGLGLILGTVILVILTTTIVSYIPAKKIAKMKPTEALKGKLQ